MGAKACCICLVAPALAERPPLCRSAACRYRYERLHPSRLCVHCLRPLAAVGSGAVSHCDALGCRQAAARQLVAEVGVRRREELNQLRANLGRRRGIAAPDHFPVVDLPTRRARLTRLPRRRLALFRAHLEALAPVALALARSGGSEVQAAGTSMASSHRTADDIAASGCANCRGYCCATGARTHAWLRAETLAGFAHKDLTMTAPALVEHYLSFVGERISRNSCVYHGPRGCTLPREMRADICNEYFCPPLIELRAQTTADAPARAFLVTREADGSSRGQFVSLR